MSTRIVLPFAAATIRTPGAQYGDREYWSGTGKDRRLVKHFHCAVDLQVAGGLAVRAAADGTVVEVSDSDLRGFMIAIDHGDRTGHRVHMLASRGRPAVGTKVRQGDVIGYVADEDEWGSSSNGDHIHLEYRINGAIRGEKTARANTPNPLDFARAAAPAGLTPVDITTEEAMSTNVVVMAREGGLIAVTDLNMLWIETRDAAEVWAYGCANGQFAGGDYKADDAGVRKAIDDSGQTTPAWRFDAIRRAVLARRDEHDERLARILDRGEFTASAIGGYNVPGPGRDTRGVRARLDVIERAVLAKGAVDVQLDAKAVEKLAPLFGPVLLAALKSADVATGSDVEASQQAILSAAAQLPAGVLAAFGLQRAKS